MLQCGVGVGVAVLCSGGDRARSGGGGVAYRMGGWSERAVCCGTRWGVMRYCSFRLAFRRLTSWSSTAVMFGRRTGKVVRLSSKVLFPGVAVE